jgi:hypothetical protein
VREENVPWKRKGKYQQWEHCKRMANKILCVATHISQYTRLLKIERGRPEMKRWKRGTIFESC